MNERIEPTLGPSSTPAPAQRAALAIDGLNSRLARSAGLVPPAVTVLDWNLVNAFALPGGRIILTKGLLERSQDGSEIAAVLAHEVAHVLHRHPMTGWIRQEGTNLLLMALFGQDGTGSLAGAITGGLLNARYTREQEDRADRTAIDLLAKNGISSSGGAAFFDRLADGTTNSPFSGVLALMETHPGSEDRATLFRMAETGTDPGLDIGDLTAVKTMCG